MTDEPKLPRVSVVIPAWDAYAGERLTEAIRSVTSQPVPAELILVDNASETPLPTVPTGQVITLEQRVSTGAARNAALPCLSTPYVVFLDADDLLLDGALAALIHGLDADPGRVVHSLAILDDRTGERHRSPRALARGLSRAPGAFALANLIWSLLPTQGATIMRVTDVLACGGYADSSHGEDWVLASSLAFRGRASFERRPGMRYRPRPDSPGVGALGASILLENARQVRIRIRSDPRIPRVVKTALPAITLAQWLAARVAHPLYRRLRAAMTPATKAPAQERTS